MGQGCHTLRSINDPVYPSFGHSIFPTRHSDAQFSMTANIIDVYRRVRVTDADRQR